MIEKIITAQVKWAHDALTARDLVNRPVMKVASEFDSNRLGTVTANDLQNGRSSVKNKRPESANGMMKREELEELFLVANSRSS